MTDIVDQLNQKIKFFEASSDAKQKLMKSENERLKLEMELSKLTNSDEAV
jgi:hypothetical protein